MLLILYIYYSIVLVAFIVPLVLIYRRWEWYGVTQTLKETWEDMKKTT